MRFLTSSILAILAQSLPCSLLSAQDPDVDVLEKQLVKIFERPSGTPIGPEQKKALGEFLANHKGQLGRLGYAQGLHSYLMRDYAAATTQLDTFFAKHDTIAIQEHRMIAGRIYMSSFMRLAATKDPERDVLCRYGERAMRLYADLQLLTRYMPRAMARIEDDATSAAVRIALVRGAMASGAPIIAQDTFVRSLYAGLDQPAEPNTGRRKASAQRPPSAADIKRNALNGTEAPALTVDQVLNGEFKTLAAWKGKVVIVDFWATWCGPCRSVIPDLVALQKEHGTEVQILGATRFYGYGSDFSGPEAKPPHGGAKTVRNLDRNGEVEINKTFAKVFELNYPIVFTSKEVFAGYGVRGIPTVFVIGRDGKVVGSVVGSKNHDELDKLLSKALGKR